MKLGAPQVDWTPYLEPGGRDRFRFELLRLPSGESMGEALARDPWQRDWWEIIDENLRVAMIVASRGCGKSTWLAAASIELLVLESNVEIVIVSGDQEQAGIVHSEASGFVRREGRLEAVLDVRAAEILNTATKCRLRTMSSDVASSYGIGAKRTLIIFDELHVATNRGLLDSMLSSVAKAPGSRLLAITNAGYRDTPAWELRQQCRAGDDPALRYWDAAEQGVQPSWISEEELARQERLLPPSVFRRLWRCEWQSGAGDYLLEEQVDACIDPKLDPLSMQFSAQHGHFIGVDAGLRHDRTVVAVVRKEGERIDCVHLATWYGSQEHPVSLEAVFSYVLDLSKRIPRLRRMLYDPWQLQHAAERWRRAGIHCTEEFTFTTQNLQLLSQSLWSYFRDGRIRIPDHPELRDELVGARVIERKNSWRVDHQAGSGNFSDHLIALGMAVVAGIPDRGQIVVENPRLNWLIDYFKDKMRGHLRDFGFGGKESGIYLVDPTELGPRPWDVYSAVRLYQLLELTERLSRPELEALARRIRERGWKDPAASRIRVTDQLGVELGLQDTCDFIWGEEGHA